MITPDVIRRHEIGDHITDEEMLELMEVYKRLASDSLKLGTRWHLSFKEASRQLYGLRDSARYRGITK